MNTLRSLPSFVGSIDEIKEFGGDIQDIAILETIDTISSDVIKINEIPKGLTEKTIDCVSEPPAKKKKFSPNHEIDLKSVLENNVIGQAILTTYEYKKTLSTQCHSYLCDIIVTNYFQRNI